MAKKGKVKPPSSGTYEEQRPARSRKYKQYFLVVCEDQATEPAYFGHFRAAFEAIAQETMFFKAVGTGRDPLGVVEQAIAERQRLKDEARKDIDFVWAVFDRDDAHLCTQRTARFQQAFTLAHQEKLQIAYSNETFELWLLLHLQPVNPQVPLPRKTALYPQLEQAVQQQGPKYANFAYKHGDKTIVEVVRAIGNEALAIKRAKDLEVYHQKNQTAPIAADPSTRVYLLVEELRAWLDFYTGD